MKYWKISLASVVIVAVLVWGFWGRLAGFGRFLGLLRGENSNINLTGLTLPSGFKLEVVVKNLNKPRVIVFDAKERMLVSELGANQITIFEPGADGKLVGRILIEKLRSPHGLAFYTDQKKKVAYLYVAESYQVVRYIYNVASGSVVVSSAENIANFSDTGLHITRTIAFGPNFRTTPIVKGYLDRETQLANKLYVSVGSSCNVCVEESWKRGAILEADPEGTFLAEFAGGLRNSVFFTFHPKTGQLWATEMGRDNLGDKLPPDEINIVKVANVETPFGARRYGWPFCYGDKIKDSTFNPAPFQRTDVPKDCTKTESSYLDIPAHSAPLGLAFITDPTWPTEWQDDLLVAYHGSWNSTAPVGYKIVRFVLAADGNITKDVAGQPQVEDFITGWLSNGKVSGRPVDLKFHAGSLFISDDYSGVIYKVSRVSQ
ncbi:MAG: hypothetical protein A3I32_02500 [Candidatus Yanofskybacteria bacterium RIFCSPLOWO2_02_FULL_45_10]|uniref:Pyrroloquinoline quinone-dependent pyranose dehydrogenase beta-propeller domain-containing protein n=1 Tax=Candidatus Yanofskybacteria bacterium RIFCSPLOWO2_02_FULL_45_10 TaxID=1802706 RepID=A0A1F8H3U4_9BACT|nr:MAG: hypothetical protein A3I32_02500 [Candidatus Yanofskybacteria bacterium RIFCSPLOWO2_02_FULL_45_10]